MASISLAPAAGLAVLSAEDGSRYGLGHAAEAAEGFERPCSLPATPDVHRPPSSPTLALFLLDGEVVRGQVLTLADRVRRQLLSLGEATPTLLGKVEGRAREDGHQHLHILPEGPRDGEVLSGHQRGLAQRKR